MVLVPSVASASQDSTAPVVAALENITDLAGDEYQAVLEGSVAGDAAGAGVAAELTVAESTVTLPTEASDGIEFSEEQTVVLGLPFAEQAASAEISASGVVVYDNGNGSSTAPVLKQDGSVQITTVIENEDAPQRYAYDYELPEGGSVEFFGEDGAVIVLDADGEFLLGIAPPWATDASGVAVPTRYEIAGDTLTQVVEHEASHAYPVVADPWAGGNLLVYANVTNDPKGKVVNAKATAHGRLFNGLATHASHVQELKDRLGPHGYHLVDQAHGTIREQFLCHVAGNYFEQGIYNMESWRPSKHWATQLNLTDQCNPK